MRDRGSESWGMGSVRIAGPRGRSGHVTARGGRQQPAAVYRSVNNPYIDAYLRHQRRDIFPGGLFGRGKVEGDHGDDQKTGRLLMDHVRRGRKLGLICDLYDRNGLPVPFFGKDARTVTIAPMIAANMQQTTMI